MSIKKTISGKYIIGYKSDVINQYKSPGANSETPYAVHTRRSSSIAASGDHIGRVCEIKRLIGTRGSSPSAATTIIGYTAPQDDTAETNVGCVYVLTASAATSTGANGATTNRFGGDIHGNPPMRLTASNTQGGGGAARYIGYAGSTWSSSGDTPLRNHGLSICPNLYNAVTGAYMHRVLCGDDNYYDGSD